MSSFFRKAFWPGALAVALVVLTGAFGHGFDAKPASAFYTEICDVAGPSPVTVGDTFGVIAYIDGSAGDLWSDDVQFDASVDNHSGDAQIVGYLDPDPFDGAASFSDISDIHGQEDFATQDEPPAFDGTDSIGNIDVGDPSKFTEGLVDELNDHYGLSNDMLFVENVDADSGLCHDAVSGDVSGGNSCDLGDDDDDACESAPAAACDIDVGDDCASVVIVIVKCLSPGTFDVGFDPNEDNVIGQDETGGSVTITCVGLPATVSLVATPTSVENVPALGNIAHSLLILTVADAGGGVPLEGDDVDWSLVPTALPAVNSTGCQIKAIDDGADTLALFLDIKALFDGLVSTNPSTHWNLETNINGLSPHSPPDTTGPTFTWDPGPPGPVGGGPRLIAAGVLHCDIGTATPGVATVRAEVDAFDLAATATVTVVGVPSSVVVTTDKATVICGERVTVTAKITDAIGQNVSEHTLAESFTNNGGTMGGTGAIAGFAAPITPFSSTVGETFSGVVTLFLITSDVHDGTYEIVVTSGGSGAVGSFFGSSGDVFAGGLGGWFSTPPVSGFAKITCTAAAPIPAVTGPATGTGPLRAPNTGDAGLADSSSSSTLFGLAGAVALALAFAGLATVKVANRR